MQQTEHTLENKHLEQITFLLKVFHLLDSPLAVIMGYAQLLADPTLKQDQAFLEKCQQVLVKEARQMDQIIQNTASLARLEANHHQIELSAVPLTGILDELTRSNGNKVKIELQHDMPPIGKVTIFSNPIWLVEALENLIDIVSNDSSTPIQINVNIAPDQDQGCIQLSVIHSTMTKDELSELAGYTQDLKNKQWKNITRRSLGLFLVDQVIRYHKGRLEFENSHGTDLIYSIYLPLVYQNGKMEGKQ